MSVEQALESLKRAMDQENAWASPEDVAAADSLRFDKPDDRPLPVERRIRDAKSPNDLAGILAAHWKANDYTRANIAQAIKDSIQRTGSPDQARHEAYDICRAPHLRSPAGAYLAAMKKLGGTTT